MKYKRAYFVDWRVADRIKSDILDRIDYLLDTNNPTAPKIMTGEAFRAGLQQAVHQPFRVVPFFDPSNVMALGALCDREYSFSYDAIRERKGLAWYPIVTARGAIDWESNPHYRKTNLDVRRGDHAEFGFVRGTSPYGAGGW